MFCRLSVLAFALLSIVPLPASAETFPSRPIRLIVPFPAGGPNDTIARVLGQSMTTTLGQPVVIENRGGAGGTVGVNTVAKSDPDGYTIGLTSGGPLAIIPNLQKLPYDWRSDLKIISIVVSVPEILAVPRAYPAQTIKDLIALVRANPNKYSYASVGRGSLPHMAAELLKLSLGLEIVHVPYTGAAPAITDLLNNQTQMLIADISVLEPHIAQGTLRGLAVSGMSRSSSLPDVPTVVEAGIPMLQIENWYGLIAPAKLPVDITNQIFEAVMSALNQDSVKAAMKMQGATIVGSSADRSVAFIGTEEDRWQSLVKKANLQINQ